MKSFPIWTATLATLLGASTAVAMAQQDQPRTDDDFIDRYGFEQVTQDLGTDGRERFVLRPVGRFQDGVKLAVVLRDDGSTETMLLAVQRTLLDGDSEATRALLGDFVRRVSRNSPGEPEAGRLAYLIQHDDAEVRRGVAERESTCCALPPESPQLLEAVAVVDGSRDAARVQFDDMMLRFGNTTGGGVEREVFIVASSPDGPEELVQALFDAARNADPSSLAGYCHPAIETDGDVADICSLTTTSESWESFVEWFGTGTLGGAVQIDGDVARVPFRFGPEGDREETMELQLWGDRWYLRSF